MKKENAVDFMRDIADVNAALNNLLSKMANCEDDDEIQALSKAVLGTGMHVYKELMRPIIRQFPELDPDADATK